MSCSAADDPSAEALIGRIADDFTERLLRGEQPDIEEYARRHPAIADLLRQALAALQLLGMQDLSARSGDSATDLSVALPSWLGDFQLVQEIGRGGMGIVYEAEQASLRRRVAVNWHHPSCFASSRTGWRC